MNYYYAHQLQAMVYQPQWKASATNAEDIPLAYQVTPLAIPKYKNDLTDLIGIHDTWLPEHRWESMDKDPARMILGEKADLAKLSVGAIVYQIVQREKIKDQNLLRILYQEIAIDSKILRLESAWSEDLPPQDSRFLSGLESELIRLEGEKRKEETDCWKDISRLKESLMEQLGNYRNAERKVQLIKTGLSDVVGND
jgi:hypothetical protein